jgi:hypothetical protein
MFCHGAEARKYSLNPVEWDKVAQMTKFLQPLYEATLFLCKSEYPTLNVSLPVYISLMKTILEVQSQYDADQLLEPANEMIIKLKKYLVVAMKKTAPQCAMILDPRIKMVYLEKNASFLKDELRIRVNLAEITSKFKLAALPFDCTQSRTQSVATKSPRTIENSSLLTDVFGCVQRSTNLDSEIHQYLHELTEPADTKVLDYWHRKQEIYPSLSAMASCFLAIPATSASSERVFSKSKTIVGAQRSSLSATSIEQLLCLKEWYRSTGNLDPLPYEHEPEDSDGPDESN